MGDKRAAHAEGPDDRDASLGRWSVLTLLTLVGGLCAGCPEPPRTSGAPDARFSTPVFLLTTPPDTRCDLDGDGTAEPVTVDAPGAVTLRCLGDPDGDGYADVAVLPRDDARTVYLFKGGPERAGPLSLAAPDAVLLNDTENMNQP